MQHKGLWLYQFCSNNDPWLTVTYFPARSNLAIWAFVWEKANSGFFWSYCSLWHQSCYLQSAKWFFINTKGQGHLLTFVLDASVSCFILFSSKTTGLIETKLHVEPLFDWGMIKMLPAEGQFSAGVQISSTSQTSAKPANHGTVYIPDSSRLCLYRSNI